MSQSLFRLVLLIFVVATRCSLIAQPALAGTAAFNCPPCPTLNHVVLMIGLPSDDSEARNQTQLWIAKHSLAAQQLHRQRTGETIPTITKYPANVADFRRDLQQIAIACMRVEALGIMSHGNIGYLLIGTDGVNEHNLDDVFGHGLGCVMSPQASIEFAGCNVGRGCRGADFMRGGCRSASPSRWNGDCPGAVCLRQRDSRHRPSIDLGRSRTAGYSRWLSPTLDAGG